MEFIFNKYTAIMKTLFILLTLLFGVLNLNLKAQRDIVISTDCAVDDLRSLCEFLAVPEINIKAVISSDGMLSPGKGRIKILELLYQLNKKDIPVGEGKLIHKEASSHAGFLKSVYWGDAVIDPGASVQAEEILKTVFANSKNPVTIICLGPLTDIYEFVKKYPEQKAKIKNIIWYNNTVQPLSGTNYDFDKKAAETLLKEHISIDVISNTGNRKAVVTKEYLNNIYAINTPYAKLISRAHQCENVIAAIDSGYFELWDDLIPVFYLYPALFDMEPLMGNPSVSITKDISFEAVKEKILQILSQTYSLENNITFDKFPADSTVYQYDVKEIMNEVINKYGKEEWRVCVLTNEIHGHLGTYSIVGAKMGMRARDIFIAEIDRIEVFSFAGDTPPLSCMNDGIQISTGATLGLGMIKISSDQDSYPSAIFTYKGKKIKLTLKKDIYENIERDIENSVLKYGGLTEGYWKLIRAASLKHWLELDRSLIFDMEELK